MLYYFIKILFFILDFNILNQIQLYNLSFIFNSYNHRVCLKLLIKFQVNQCFLGLYHTFHIQIKYLILIFLKYLFVQYIFLKYFLFYKNLILIVYLFFMILYVLNPFLFLIFSFFQTINFSDFLIFLSFLFLFS